VDLLSWKNVAYHPPPVSLLRLWVGIDKRTTYILSHSPAQEQGQDDEQDQPGQPARDVDGDLGTLAHFAPRDGLALFPVLGDGGP
jgi:hypothetical protein